MASETVFGSSSYGPETAVVQFAVSATAGALGTFVAPSASRINRITIKNLEGVAVTIKVQETDTNPNGADGTPSWSDVSGATATIVAGGTAVISLPGLILKKYARLYGNGSSGSAICRATIDDVDMLNNFRQVSPYGVG